MQAAFFLTTREHSSVGLERLLDKQEVSGSNPLVPTGECRTEGTRAGESWAGENWVGESRTGEQRVGENRTEEKRTATLAVRFFCGWIRPLPEIRGAAAVWRRPAKNR